jgi:hypothetical protein
LIKHALFNFCSCGENLPDFQLTPYRAAFPNCGYLQHRVAPGVIHGTLRRVIEKVQSGSDRLSLIIKPGLTNAASMMFSNEEELLALQNDPIKFNDGILYPKKVRGKKMKE